MDSRWLAHRWRYLCLGAAVWLGSAVLMRALFDRMGWPEALLLTFFILANVAVGAVTMWLWHSKIVLNAKSALIMVGITVAGALVGGAFGIFMKGGAFSLADGVDRLVPKLLLVGLVIGIVYTTFGAAVVQIRRRQLQARNLVLEQQAKEDRSARQLTEAKLKLMQAQVEPHFLFNTLASVQHLAEGRAPEAAQLTRELIAFLRAGLTGLREETTTLKAEFAMAAAYLAIMQTRMGSRLRYTLDLPIVLEAARVPPAMLISLVENAIKHGIEPAPEGGAIHLFARIPDGVLQFGVADTGLGLVPKNKTASGIGGLGLTNIRERLLVMLGEQAKLDVMETPPRGVTATISIMRQAELQP